MSEDNDTESNSRCGYVAVIGRPNVGKSTLLNRVLDQKLSIVTAKPQTTRNRILAVYNKADMQAIFLDTPGLHSPRASLGRYMVEAAESAIAEADICVWLLDMGAPKRSPGITDDEREIGARLSSSGLPVMALLNKIDLVKDKSLLLPTMEAAAAVPGVREVIPISSLEGEGVARFMTALFEILPRGPKLYPEDMLSEQAERFFVSELVREALMELTRQEVPYHSAVVVDKFVEEPKRCTIHATVHVERTTQRAIVIGKRGAMIREISKRARLGAEAFLGTPVYLKLHVEVSPGWTRDTKKLEEMGYK
jgi:GTP-binding protein Era